MSLDLISLIYSANEDNEIKSSTNISASTVFQPLEIYCQNEHDESGVSIKNILYYQIISTKRWKKRNS